MRAWSLQPWGLWERLRSGERLLSAPDFPGAWGERPGDSWGFRQAYGWMAFRMDEAGIPRPDGAEFPFWAWAWWEEGGKARPDGRSSRPRGEEPLALLELEIPEGDFLLSDFDLWHFVLNYWPIALGAMDERELERSFRLGGSSPYRTKPLPPDLAPLVERRWPLALDLSPLPGGGWDLSPNIGGWQRRWIGAKKGVPRKVQASFWELRPDMVRSARRIAPILQKSIETSPPLL